MHKAAGAAPGAQKKHRFLREIWEHPACYIMMLPAAVYTVIFGYMTYPFMFTAFQKYSYRTGLFGSPFVGLQHFKVLFANNNIWNVILNTVYLNVLFLVFINLFALLMALLLSNMQGRYFQKVSLSVILFPKFLSWMVIAYILYALLGSVNGLVNNLLTSLGFDAVNWYSTPGVWPTILTGMKVWTSSGMKAIIFMSTILSFDTQIYEAAEVDGAGKLRCMMTITIPLLLPTMCILSLMDIGRIFNGDFGMIYALIGDNGVLFPTTDVIDTYVFRIFRKFGSVEQASAVGLLQSIFGFLMVLGANWFTKKHFKEGALF